MPSFLAVGGLLSMSMRTWLSRLWFWLATLCALASFLLPGPAGARLGTFAIVALALSLLFWRRWKPPRIDALAPESSVLDDEGLLDASARIARCCALASGLDDALRGAGRVLAQELGARNVVAARVEYDHEQPRLKSVLDLSLPRLRANAARPSAVASRALRERGIVSDASLGHAVPVLDQGVVVALIEFEALELVVTPAALMRLLELARAELCDVAVRCAKAPLNLAASRVQAMPAEADAPEFLAAIDANRQVSLFVMEPAHCRIVAMSRRAEREFRIRRRHVLGKTAVEAFGSSVGRATSLAIKAAIETGRTAEQEVHWATPRGQRGANASVCALRHADGTPRWLIAMARDLQSADLAGGDRRAMPRHGWLHDDAKQEPVLALPRPVAAAGRSDEAR